LSLHSNNIGDEAKALAKNTTLTFLGLRENKIGAVGKEALRNSPNLNLRKILVNGSPNRRRDGK
jgi:hypothetical protein